jgi:hypothetical protein
VRLSRIQLDLISRAVVEGLAQAGYVEASDPTALTEQVRHLIAEDLLVEDRLNDEVREILGKHEGELRRQGVEYHEMFKVIKQKLVRERKLIL